MRGVERRVMGIGNTSKRFFIIISDVDFGFALAFSFTIDDGRQ